MWQASATLGEHLRQGGHVGFRRLLWAYCSGPAAIANSRQLPTNQLRQTNNPTPSGLIIMAATSQACRSIHRWSGVASISCTKCPGTEEFCFCLTWESPSVSLLLRANSLLVCPSG